ncbi:PREDICTED: uncharacterized protein LOC107538500 [Miniopterus natalensis]|uniref:uncharacterized protein LOC107538500 n=1 Tax=Miniopterus natalensis TaxID=291302 RepID=UPI0007A70893|nr:PREDICTED: uncharacterized protein LOC107538500 [Miniopterus natalensis]
MTDGRSSAGKRMRSPVPRLCRASATTEPPRRERPARVGHRGTLGRSWAGEREPPRGNVRSQDGHIRQTCQHTSRKTGECFNEKLAWVKASRDPRIASGQQSPLEKKILNLGGVHTKAARQLITQKNQEEYQTLYREQDLSLDYWLARVESYYSKRLVDMLKEQETGNGVEKKLEGKTTQSTERQKRCYLVPEREMRHIERHTHRAVQVREFTKKTFRQLLQSPPEPSFPKIVPDGPGVQKAQRRKQVNEREQMQIKGHQERMIRGRELTEQRLKERFLRKSQNQPPRGEKQEGVRGEREKLESVTAYPLFQPHTSQVRVNILMGKPRNRQEETVVKPHQRQFLTLPPFLRSQIKIKVGKTQAGQQ